MRQLIERSFPYLVVAAVLLLMASVVVQCFILAGMKPPPAPVVAAAPKTKPEIQKVIVLGTVDVSGQVDASIIGSVGVSVENDELSVTVTNDSLPVSAINPLPVDVENEVEVNLKDHEILTSTPVPVEIVN